MKLLSLILNIIFISSLYCLDLNAATAIIDGKSYECTSKADNEEFYKCKNKSNDFLILNLGNNFVSYSANENGDFVINNVTKLTDETKNIFERISNAEFLPDTVANRKLNAFIATNYLRNVNDPLAQSLMKKAQEIVQKKIAPKKIKVTALQKDYICNSGVTQLGQSKTCHFYTCNDSEGNVAHVYFDIPENSTANPYVLTINKNDVILLNDSLKIVDLDSSSNNVPLFESLRISERTEDPRNDMDAVKEVDYFPDSLKSKRELYKVLTSQQNFGNSCSDSKNIELFKKENLLLETLNQDILNESMSYLTILSWGNLDSVLIPTANVAKYGCLKNGNYIAPKAFEHIDYLNKLNEKNTHGKILSKNEVQELFKTARSMKDIAFNYVADGCFARAHLMARKFESMGIATQKAWISGDLSIPEKGLKWNYHVAPVVLVQDSQNSTPVKYVIDPSIAEKAIPLDDWVAKLTAHSNSPIIKTSFPVPSNSILLGRTAIAISSTTPYLLSNPENLPDESNMADAKATMSRYLKNADSK